MRIVFDNIIYSLQHYGGISVVWNNLVSHIAASEHEVQFVEYKNAERNLSRHTLHLPQQKIVRGKSFMMPLRRYFNPDINSKIFTSGDATNQGRFIFHSSYFRICKDPKAVNITTVHDFTYEFFVHNWMKRKLHCRQKHAAIREAQHVVCISENTRRDLLRLLPDVDPAKVSVIYNGVEQNRFYRLPDVEHQDFALFVGRRDPYKNFLQVLQPLAQLGIPLRVVGNPLSKVELAQIALAGIDCRYLGIVSTEQLNRLYNEALFLCFPSQYEGFGLPILEAQMAGCPVLAFNGSSVPEVIGDPSLMVDELTTEAIAQKVARFRDESTRASIVAQGIENASHFTWERMATQYLDLYQRVLDENKNTD